MCYLLRRIHWKFFSHFLYFYLARWLDPYAIHEEALYQLEVGYEKLRTYTVYPTASTKICVCI